MTSESIGLNSEAETIPPRKKRGPGRLGAIALVLALGSTSATFMVLAGLTPVEPNHQVVVITLFINVIFGVLLLGMIIWQLRALRIARRRREAGAQLHQHVVGLFSIIAAVPALVLAAVAAITLDRGLDEWFSTRARNIVDNALVVARAYLGEQARTIRGETLAMANDLNRLRPVFDSERDRFRDLLTVQATIRGMQGAYILRRDMTVVERVSNEASRAVPLPPASAFNEATDEEPALIAPGSQNLIGALFKLAAYDDLWLFVARPVDPKATQYLRMTELAVAEYTMLEQRRFGVQVAFGLMYLIIGLTLLLSAIWMGLAFANRLVSPISRLISAADQVMVGNLYVQVPVGRGEGDLGGLSETFNRMTDQLRSQRSALLEASDQIDDRRRFTEAVLSGVSAGVLGLDPDGHVTLLNRTAERMIGRREADILGHRIQEGVPELAELFEETRRNRSRLAQGTMALTRAGRERTLNVRFTSERSQEGDHGYVVTLDDITDLVTAQRTSAWADVARRIAHEIKNPLTPIQLSAERIRRKYGKMITDDREVFDQCTDTIVRQVDDIKRMVDEFSSFARMPKAVIEADEVAETIKQVVGMMQVGNPDIEIIFAPPPGPLIAHFDRRLLSQALTNVIKNAAESISAVPEEVRGPGAISVTLNEENGFVVLEVVDNGTGLPKENRSRLLEPYMTTREKGTGLGLAIVTKILEDHGGGIELTDAPSVADGGRGALVRIWFPKADNAAAAQPETMRNA